MPSQRWLVNLLCRRLSLVVLCSLLYTPAEALTGSGTPVLELWTIAVEPAGTIVVTDEALAAVVRVDPGTGDRSLVSGRTTGGGPTLEQPLGIVVESSGGLVVTDPTRPAVVRVDPVTGTRTIISGCPVVEVGGPCGAALVGSGPPLVIPWAIGVEPTGNLVVTDTALQAVFRVHAVTGERSVVSGCTAIGMDGSCTGPIIGAGPVWLNPAGVSVDATGTLVVADGALAAILRVDPVTGDRTVVSDPTVGSGPPLEATQGIALEASGALIVINPVSVIRVDPVTGDRTVVSDPDTGSGPPFVDLRGIAADATGALVVTDRRHAAVVRVDPVTGDRTLVSGGPIGTGPSVLPGELAVEATGMLIGPGGDTTIVRVDPLTGDRTLVSGAGPPFICPSDIAVEASGTLVLPDACQPVVLRVDPVTGDRSLVSSETMGGGLSFLEPGAVAVEAVGSLVVADQGRRIGSSEVRGFQAVVRVDAVTGDRTLVSGGGLFGCQRGRGSCLIGVSALSHMALAVEGDGRLIVVYGTFSGWRLIRVDPQSGHRTIVSSETIGQGPPLAEPHEIAVEATGTLVVVSINNVLRVDPVTGDRASVSGCPVPQGACTAGEVIGEGPLGCFADLAVEAEGSWVVMDACLGALLRVDPVTGDRTVVSYPGPPPSL